METRCNAATAVARNTPHNRPSVGACILQQHCATAGSLCCIMQVAPPPGLPQDMLQTQPFTQSTREAHVKDSFKRHAVRAVAITAGPVTEHSQQCCTQPATPAHNALHAIDTTYAHAQRHRQHSSPPQKPNQVSAEWQHSNDQVHSPAAPPPHHTHTHANTPNPPHATPQP